jgi:AcrR family transcriptional regulator
MWRVTQGRLQRASYHHGDLANALTRAATELARHGGPEAVVLREAARQVGVSATAAYRHFTGHGDLIRDVKQRCQAALAEHMRAELAAGVPASDPHTEAVRHLRALGLGYIRFALAEPGLFRTAFCHTDSVPHEKEMDRSESPAYAILADALDEMMRLGMIDEDRRPYCETVAWATAHGLATLFVDGPLADVPVADREAAIVRTLDAIIEGICRPAPIA